MRKRARPAAVESDARNEKGKTEDEAARGAAGSGEIMSGTGGGSGDVKKLLSLDTNALHGQRYGGADREAGCCCCCCGGGPKQAAWLGPSDDALKERGKHVERLVPAAKALLAAAQEALTTGATTAAEIREMQRLELWLGRLLVEQEMHRPPQKKR